MLNAVSAPRRRGCPAVFFMQTGFAMLEVGSVDSKNTRNILLKVRQAAATTILVAKPTHPTGGHPRLTDRPFHARARDRRRTCWTRRWEPSCGTPSGTDLRRASRRRGSTAPTASSSPWTSSATARVTRPARAAPRCSWAPGGQGEAGSGGGSRGSSCTAASKRSGRSRGGSGSCSRMRFQRRVGRPSLAASPPSVASACR